MARSQTLEPPDAEPYTARFAGAGSLRTEIEALLRVAPVETTGRKLRGLVVEDNVVAKGSSSARAWVWTRLKLRYALDDPLPAEFAAFRQAWEAAASPDDRGLICGLMVARTDRTFRELTLEFVSPHLGTPGTVISLEPFLERISGLQNVPAHSDISSARFEWLMSNNSKGYVW